jgi:hypothetical protein
MLQTPPLIQATCFPAPTEARCAANAAYVQRFQRCEHYTPVTLTRTPGVEYAVFSLQLWCDEANTVCSTIGKRLVKLANPSVESELQLHCWMHLLVSRLLVTCIGVAWLSLEWHG